MNSLESSLRQLAESHFDAILCDHELRTGSGMDVLAALRRRGIDIPFLVVTSVLADEAAAEYLEQGASDCVLKHRFDRLPFALRRALRDRARRQKDSRLQEQIRRGKEEWERTFDAVPDAIVVMDSECRIRRANRAAARLVGTEPAGMIGNYCYEVLHGKSEPRPDCPHQITRTTGQQSRGDLEETPLGKVFDAVATPMLDTNGTVQGCVHVLHDITKRRNLEDQLRQAQKMEAVGRLAGGVAHDFNNLLTIIGGYSDLLLNRTDGEDVFHGYLEEIRKASDRAAILTRQLLAFGRKQPLTPKALNLNDVVANTEKLLRRLIGEDIRVVTRLSGDIGIVNVDPGQMEQVLFNLAVNARDAMPEGGSLTIETANVALDEDSTRSHIGLVPGSYVLLTVGDIGAGMTPDVQARAFEPFFTTKEPGKGTGLGLSTVYGIVQQSEGHIELESEPGRGTTFRIYFPKVGPGFPEAGEQIPRLEDLKGKEAILLVEDEEEVRDLAGKMLGSSGYRVLPASNAATAIRLFDQHRKRVDMLLTDVVMPGMSGRQLADQLTELQPDMRVIYMSGYTDERIGCHGAPDSARTFLQKPFTPLELLRKVRKVLGESPVSSGESARRQRGG